MKRNSLALVIVLTILITGCKQATGPSVPNVTVPEVINLVGLTTTSIAQASEDMPSIGEAVILDNLTTSPVNVTWKLESHIDKGTKESALQSAVVWSLNQEVLKKAGVKNIEAANVSVEYTETLGRSAVTANTGTAVATVSNLQALDGYAFIEGINSFTIHFTEESIVLTNEDLTNMSGVKPSIGTESSYYAVGDWDLDNAELSDAKIEITELKTAKYEQILESIKSSLTIANVTVTNIKYKDELTGDVTVDNDGSVTVVVALSANNGYVFEGLVKEKTIELTINVEQLQPILDVATFIGRNVTEAVKTAGVATTIDLGSETALEVSFNVADIFKSGTRKTAVKNMIISSFTEVLYDDYKVTIKADSVTVEEGATPSVSFTLIAPEQYTFKATETAEQTVIIALSNEYNAFAGVTEVENTEINIPYGVPVVEAEIDGLIEKAVVMGSTGWAIQNGENAYGARKLLAKEDTKLNSEIIAKAIASKIVVDETSNYIYSGYESASYNAETDKVTVGMTFTSKDGFLFDDGTNKKVIDIVVIFQTGELTVNDEDFAETLDALSNPDNLGALADEDGNVTVQITGNIENEEGGEEKPFVVSGGTEDKPLNLTLTAPEGQDVSVSGGNILTSLTVSGQGTTVTIGEGITINGGYNASTGEAGGVTVKDGATFILNGGEITGNKSTVDYYETGGGSGVYVNNATFIMYKGKIHGNESVRGAGVYVSDNGVFKMYGGEITGNTALKHGGGLYVRSNSAGVTATAILYGGQIHSNTVTVGLSASKVGSGAGISIAGFGVSLIQIPENSSVEIYDNISPDDGIAIVDNGALEVKGGAIYNNKSSEGVIHQTQVVAYTSAATFLWDGGEIQGLGFDGSILDAEHIIPNNEVEEEEVVTP